MPVENLPKIWGGFFSLIFAITLSAACSYCSFPRRVKLAVISIKDYPVFVRVGYYEFERLAGQEVLVSLALEIGDLAEEEALLDELSGTLDYGLVLATVTRLVGNCSVKLIESVVGKIGRGLLSEFEQIKAIDVIVEKTRIPNGIAMGASVSVSEHFYRHELSL
jgi:FolB domain-containing protein